MFFCISSAVAIHWVGANSCSGVPFVRFWRILTYVFGVVVLLAIAACFFAWWMVHRALPQLDGARAIPGLTHEVVIQRDSFSIPHIRAQSREDAAVAEGYAMAQDRLWQMDLLRRVASGRVSEIVGPLALQSDRNFRTLGMAEAADRDVALVDPAERTYLEAFARGVNRFIEEGHPLPIEFHLLRYSPEPWRPADTLLIIGYMYQTLASSWRDDLDRVNTSARIGPERAAYLYCPELFYPYDHPVVGQAPQTRTPAECNLSGRATTTANPATRTSLVSPDSPPLADDSSALLGTFAQRTLVEADDQIRQVLGSNNWVVSGAHTASGKPLLANDPHLSLSTPSIWYMVQLSAPDWSAEGFTLPGIPGIVLGHNDHVAWGFTNNGADVQDIYEETFNTTNPNEYRVNGNWVPAVIRPEIIKIKGAPSQILNVVVTRHGPIVAGTGDKRYAVRWTATEPGGLAHSYFNIQFARNWQEFRDGLRDSVGPAQNVVYADTDGHIGFIVPARIPIRKCGAWPPPGSPVPPFTHCGAAPLPGDTNEYDWNGYIPFDELPQVLDPPEGIIATANAAVVGPGYTHYLTDEWGAPWRTDRIYRLLSVPGKKFQPADFTAIQMDIVSEYNLIIAKALVDAAHKAEPKDPRTKELIDLLADWDGSMKSDSVEATFATVTASTLMHNLFQPYLGNAGPIYSGNEVFVARALRDRPPIWLPKGYANYDELLIASADDAVKRLTDITHQSNFSAWRWGNQNMLFMPHPLGMSGILARVFSTGPMSQDGSPTSVKAMNRSHGPSFRMVADTSDWDHSLMVITTGESGQLGSGHYSDQFHLWFTGPTPSEPFTDAAVTPTIVHTLHLVTETR
jgi:penicillin G amidase